MAAVVADPLLLPLEVQYAKAATPSETMPRTAVPTTSPLLVLNKRFMATLLFLHEPAVGQAMSFMDWGPVSPFASRAPGDQIWPTDLRFPPSNVCRCCPFPRH